jgi:hypothetical protein
MNRAFTRKASVMLAYVVPLALLWPDLIWISVDRSVWPWDPAFYGKSAVELFSDLIHSPGHWVLTMLDVLPATAPGVSWFGQVFVPLGYLIGSIDVGLLTFIWITQIVTLVLIYKSLGHLSDHNQLVSTTGCLVTVSAPLFVGLSHQFFAEPLQLLAVAWFVLIMSGAPHWTRAFAVSQLLAAIPFALLAKASSPLYCAGPGVVALWHIFKGRRSFWAKREWLEASVVITLVAGVFLNLATLAWYYKNLGSVVQHMSVASSGPVAELYGQTDTFLNALLFWLQATQQSFFLPSVLLVGVVLVLFGTFRQFVSAPVKADNFTMCSALAVMQVLVVLAAFSLSANRDVRFLLPLLPYFSLAVSWGAARLNSRLVTAAVILVWLTQFTVVHGRSFGFMSSNQPLPYLAAINSDDRTALTVESIVDKTCADTRVQSDVERYWNIVGDSRPWLNVNTLGYVAAKKFTVEDQLRCSYSGIGGYFVDDAKAEWNRILSLNPHYYIATDPDVYPVPDDKVSRAIAQLNLPVLNEIERSGLFKPEPALHEDPGIMIFRREKPVKQFSRVEASAVAEAGLPAVRGALFGRHFELLGALMTPTTEGIELRLAWRCVSAAVLDRLVAVHFVDEAGKVLAQSDFPQDVGRSPVLPGAEWVDHVFVPREKLVGALQVAIALYTPGRMEPIDRGSRDWDGHRLLLPLDETLARGKATK